MTATARALSLPSVRFVLVGIANTLTGLLVIYMLKWVFGARDLTANLTGYSLGLVLSYVLNAHWTFSFRGRHVPALPRFILVIAVAYLTNLAAVYAALYLSINSYLAQATGVGPYALVTYFGSKLFVFRSHHGLPANSAARR